MALHFVLDGYNIIHQVSSLTEGKLKETREKLIRLIETKQPQGSLKNRITVVFDGQPDVGGYPYAPTSVKVIFTSGESADEKIKRIVDEDEQKKSIVVVTDDRAIQYHVRALGAKVLGVGEFVSKIKPSQGKAKRENKKAISKTLEHKINTELEEIWLRQNHKKR